MVYKFNDEYMRTHLDCIDVRLDVPCRSEVQHMNMLHRLPRAGPRNEGHRLNASQHGFAHLRPLDDLLLTETVNCLMITFKNYLDFVQTLFN